MRAGRPRRRRPRPTRRSARDAWRAPSRELRPHSRADADRIAERVERGDLQAVGAAYELARAGQADAPLAALQPDAARRGVHPALRPDEACVEVAQRALLDGGGERESTAA